ncbi:MAG: VCBS repeat-containing protein [Planctomycetota bacterium]
MILTALLVAAAMPQFGSSVYGVERGSGDLVRSVTTSFGAGLELVGPAGVAIEALDFDAAGRHLWAVSRAAGGGVQLGTLDLAHGGFTPRSAAAITGPVTDLAASPDGLSWFMAEVQGPDAVVWQGSVQSGNWTPLATLAGAGPLAGLSVDLGGRVVAVEGATGALVALDPLTGASAPLATLPAGAALPLGMDFDWGTGQLVAIVDPLAPRLVELNPASGAVTVLEALPAAALVGHIAVRRGGDSLVVDVACAPAQPNSTGVAGRIGARGSASIEHNDVVLFAGSLPAGSFGLFLGSFEVAAPLTLPGSIGRLCLGGPIARIARGPQLLATGSAGAFSTALDLAAFPLPTGAAALEGWRSCYFQAWYRDSLAGAATSNFTAAARVDLAERMEDEPYADLGLPTGRLHLIKHLDIDGDGDQDVLDFDQLSTSHTLYINEGGRLHRREPLALGVPVRSFEFGDFDGDGAVDIVAITGQAVRVLWNDGATFSQSTQVAACWAPQEVAAGDVDGDGLDDIVYHCDPQDLLLVLYSAGGRAFESPRSLIHTAVPGQQALGDVDQDGRTDIVLLGWHASGTSPAVLKLEVLRSLPGRAFAQPVPLPVGALVSGPVLVDLDSDGDLDLYLSLQSGGGLMRFSNDGGTFSAAPDIATPGPLVAAAVGDVDGDGTLDLVTASTSFDGVSVALGVAGGGYGPPTSHPTGKGPSSVALVDLDADGLPEALVQNRDSEYLTVLQGTAEGYQRAPLEVSVPINFYVPSPGQPWVELERRDFDADGDVDVFFASTMVQGTGHRLFRNQGDGTFGAPEAIVTPLGSLDVEFADFDRDGDLDLFQLNAGRTTVTIALGDGAGGFTPLPEVPMLGFLLPHSAAVGDIDRDGNVDVVVGVYGALVMRGDGAGGFIDQREFLDPTGSFWSRVEVADLDGDGWLDVIGLRSLSPQLQVRYGDGLGSLAPPVPAGNASRDFTLADLDDDGRLDLIGVSTSPSNVSAISVLYQRSPRSFEPVALDVHGDVSKLLASDVDGDGLPDLVVLFNDPDCVGILRNDGFGGFERETRFYAGAGLAAMFVADLDGDSAPDLAVCDGVRRVLAVFPNRAR